MPIHHDKAVYGKLAASKETISDDDLIALAQELSSETEECEKNSGKKLRKEDKNEK